MKKLRYLSILVIIIIVGLALAFLLSNPETIPPFSNAMLMTAVPLILGIFLAARLKASWRIYGIGATAFIASQILHIPFNRYILLPALNVWGTGQILYAVMVGLSAGIFEETARWIAYRKYLPKMRSWAGGLMYGAGHGGIEAIILGTVTLYIFLQMLVLRDLSPENLKVMVGADSVDATQVYLAAYWGAPWYASLLGAMERISAIMFHLAASLLVLMAVQRRNPVWYAAAVAWHTAINAVAVYAAKSLSIYQTEGLIFLFGLLSLGIVFTLRSAFLPEEEPGLQTAQALPVITPINNLEISKNSLEDSRYD